MHAYVCCQGWTLEAINRILGGGHRVGFLYSHFSAMSIFSIPHSPEQLAPEPKPLTREAELSPSQGEENHSRPQSGRQDKDVSNI